MVVYRYIDKDTEQIKYVGIVHGITRTLRQRVYEHKKYDEWPSTADWKIEYIEMPNGSRTDAEYLEAHLISLYGTHEWHNKAKSGWGVSDYLPKDFEWRLYDDSKPKVIKVEKQSNNIERNKIKLEKLEKLYSLIESYKEEERVANFSEQIKKCFHENKFETCGVSGYVRMRVKGEIESAHIFKDCNYKDRCRGKFDNLMPYVIDVSNSSDYDGVNNIEFTIHRSVKDSIDNSVSRADVIRKICIKKAIKIFKCSDEVANYMIKEIEMQERIDQTMEAFSL